MREVKMVKFRSVIYMEVVARISYSKPKLDQTERSPGR